MTTGDAALAIVAGALATLERKTLGQFMLSRPIVVAPLVAALVGNAEAGLLIGIPLELYFLGSASYGAAPPPHETVAALFAGAFVASASIHPSAALLACAAFASLPLSLAGREVEAGLERWNVGLVDRAESLLALGRPARATRQALIASFWVAFLGGCATALGLLAGPAAGRLVPEFFSESLQSGLGFAWPLFLGLSAAMALRAIRTAGGAKLSGLAAVTVFAVFGVLTLLD